MTSISKPNKWSQTYFQNKTKLLTFNTGIQTLWWRWINSSCINKKKVQSNETLTSQIMIWKWIEMKLITLRCWIPCGNVVPVCIILALLIMQIYKPPNPTVSAGMYTILFLFPAIIVADGQFSKASIAINIVKLFELHQLQYLQMQLRQLRIWHHVFIWVNA